MGKFITPFFEDITGEKFYMLTAIKYSHRDKSSHHVWIFRCECGKEVPMRKTCAVNGYIKSCGCVFGFKGDEGNFRSLIAIYRKNARKREIKFELTEDQFRILTKSNCGYFGSIPLGIHHASGKIHKAAYIYNGVDRVINEGNYSLDNCISCCKHCNIAKTNRTVNEFKEHVENMYNHMFKKDKK